MLFPVRRAPLTCRMRVVCITVSSLDNKVLDATSTILRKAVSGVLMRTLVGLVHHAVYDSA